MELSIAERFKRLSPRGVSALSALALAATLSGCGGADEQKVCEPHRVFAQGMWYPPGAAVRERPDRSARQVGSLGPNQEIHVDYWLHTGKIAYENNKGLFKSDVWLHLVDKATNEWVNYAAVRAKIVPDAEYDRTGLKPDIGGAVNLPPECQLNDVKPGESPTLPVLN